MLKRLAEIGMELAEVLLARAAEADQSPAEATAALAKVARSVRQTMALDAKLAEGLRARNEAARAARLELQARADRERVNANLRLMCRKADVLDAIEIAIEDDAPESDAERLYSDLYERLEDVSDEVGFADRPLGEVVAAIRQDLGFPVDPEELQDPDWLLTGGLEPGRSGRPYWPGTEFGAPGWNDTGQASWAKSKPPRWSG